MATKKNTSPQRKIDLPARLRNFYKRWGFVPDDPRDYQKFKNRILIAVDEVVGDYLLLRPDVSKEYALFVGYNLPPTSVYPSRDMLLPTEFKDNPVYKILAEATEFREFIMAVQALFWVLEKYRCPYLDKLIERIQLAIRYSPNISLRIARRSGAVTLYPAGVKDLDEKLVEEPISWLKDRPTVAKHYKQALAIYLSKDQSKYRNLLDNLRLALEQLLRILLGNKKSLENQKEPLLRWLKERGAHPQVINMFHDLLARFTQYQNDAVKHGDNWSCSEIEFMIYVTGVFMRFLLELEQQP